MLLLWLHMLAAEGGAGPHGEGKGAEGGGGLESGGHKRVNRAADTGPGWGSGGGGWGGVAAGGDGPRVRFRVLGAPS